MLARSLFGLVVLAGLACWPGAAARAQEATAEPAEDQEPAAHGIPADLLKEWQESWFELHHGRDRYGWHAYRYGPQEDANGRYLHFEQETELNLNDGEGPTREAVKWTWIYASEPPYALRELQVNQVYGTDVVVKRLTPLGDGRARMAVLSKDAVDSWIIDGFRADYSMVTDRMAWLRTEPQVGDERFAESFSLALEQVVPVHHVIEEIEEKDPRLGGRRYLVRTRSPFNEDGTLSSFDERGFPDEESVGRLRIRRSTEEDARRPFEAELMEYSQLRQGRGLPVDGSCRLRIEGLERPLFARSARQQVELERPGVWQVRLHAEPDGEDPIPPAQLAAYGDVRWLTPGVAAEVARLEEKLGAAADPRTRVDAAMDLILRRLPTADSNYIRALDTVLERRQATRSARIKLLVALARGLGVPARQVQGLRLLSFRDDCVLLHWVWAEVHLDGRWEVHDPEPYLDGAIRLERDPGYLEPLHQDFWRLGSEWGADVAFSVHPLD